MRVSWRHMSRAWSMWASTTRSFGSTASSERLAPWPRQLMARLGEDRTIAPVVGPDDPRRFTDSGIEVKPVYVEADQPPSLSEELGEPGEYPFTRGVHAEMYRRQLWTIRQYAG